MTLLTRLSEHAEFTPLDRLLVSAVINARRGVAGALTEDEIRDVLREVLQLNAARARTCFHSGFGDALFGVEPALHTLPEDAESRRWYWAGAVLGWARSESWDRVIEAYDGDQAVRHLGDGAGTASSVAVEHIVQALHRARRAAELSVFVEQSAIVGSTPTLGLYRLLLRIGTELLRAGDPDVARSILDLLIDAEDELRARIAPPDEVSLLEARRRKAHCLRQLRDPHAAREVLRDLLELDPDPNIRAMVHADLGLLEGRYMLLADVQLPDSAGEDLADLRERITAGEMHFRAATDEQVRYAAHGHYPLGVLALLGGQYAEAAAALERARTCFRSRPNSYPDALIACTELYLGIAKVQILDAGDLHQGAALINAGLQGGARFPAYMIGPTVAALALDQTCIVEVARPLLDSGIDAALDALADSDALAIVPEIACELRARAGRPDRNGEAKAGDLRRALAGCLHTGAFDAAREILDQLETLATEKGVGGEAFVELLRSREYYEPAWTREDAEVAIARYQERQGSFREAITTLSGPFFRYMTRACNGDEFAFDNAAGILRAIRGYSADPAALAPDLYPNMRGRYEAVAAQWDLEPDARERRPVNVLVVGGDERQARIEERICRRVHQRDGAVGVTLVPTGWGANWSEHADRIGGQMVAHDALVIMRFMRTHLGRRIRRDCGRRNIPWRFCWGGGQRAIAEAVLRAAEAARAGEVPGGDSC